MEKQLSKINPTQKNHLPRSRHKENSIKETKRKWVTFALAVHAKHLFFIINRFILGSSKYVREGILLCMRFWVLFGSGWKRGKIIQILNSFSVPYDLFGHAFYKAAKQ